MESGIVSQTPVIFGERIKLVTSTTDYGNMAFPYGNPEEVIKNRRMFTNDVGIDLTDAVWMRPSHGVASHFVSVSDRSRGAFSSEQAILNVDILLTQKDNRLTAQPALAVNPADCPIMTVVDKNAEILGIAHSGRKGIELGVATEMLMQVVARGYLPETWLLNIGPGICNSCYRMPHLDTKDPMLWEGFAKTEDGSDFDIEYAFDNTGRRKISDGIPMLRLFPQNRAEMLQLDMVGLLYKSLSSFRLAPEQIEMTNLCTYEEAKKRRLYSHYLSSQQKKEFPESRYTTIAQLN